MTKAQEFINFLEDMQESTDIFITSYYRQGISDLIKFIKSVNPNELEAIRQHEGEEKVCIHNYKPNVDLELQCTLCFKLKNEDYAN